MVHNGRLGKYSTIDDFLFNLFLNMPTQEYSITLHEKIYEPIEVIKAVDECGEVNAIIRFEHISKENEGKIISLNKKQLDSICSLVSELNPLIILEDTVYDLYWIDVVNSANKENARYSQELFLSESNYKLTGSGKYAKLVFEEYNDFNDEDNIGIDEEFE